MSYCVNCGVELDPGAARCPLCGTPAWKPDPDAPSYFPTKPAEVPPASRRAAAALLTAMLASVSLCCGVLNLLLPTERPWSLYVIGAAVMLIALSAYGRGAAAEEGIVMDDGRARPSVCGRLQVVNGKLSDREGEPVMLRGVSFNGLITSESFLNEQTFRELSRDSINKSQRKN